MTWSLTGFWSRWPCLRWPSRPPALWFARSWPPRHWRRSRRWVHCAGVHFSFTRRAKFVGWYFRCKVVVKVTTLAVNSVNLSCKLWFLFSNLFSFFVLSIPGYLGSRTHTYIKLLTWHQTPSFKATGVVFCFRDHLWLNFSGNCSFFVIHNQLADDSVEFFFFGTGWKFNWKVVTGCGWLWPAVLPWIRCCWFFSAGWRKQLETQWTLAGRKNKHARATKLIWYLIFLHIHYMYRINLHNPVTKLCYI